MFNITGGSDQRKWLTGLTIISLVLGSVVAVKNLTRLRADEESLALKLEDLNDREEVKSVDSEIKCETGGMLSSKQKRLSSNRNSPGSDTFKYDSESNINQQKPNRKSTPELY